VVNLSNFKIADEREEEDKLIEEDLAFITANNSE
jgi:hypothetical protein